MKRFFIFAALAIMIAACNKDDNPKNFKVNLNAKVYVKPQVGTKAFVSSSVSEALTPLEVVKRATVLQGYNKKVSDSHLTWLWAGKDTTSAEPALLRMAFDIIHEVDGPGTYGLQLEFIETVDYVICSGTHPNYDTLAYIPNANMTAARQQIITAFEAKDTIAVYQIFQNAFRFVPITGAAYKELKKQGLQ